VAAGSVVLLALAAGVQQAAAAPIVVTAVTRSGLGGSIDHSNSQLLNLVGGSVKTSPLLPGTITETETLTLNVGQITNGPPVNNSVTLTPTVLTFTISNPAGQFQFQEVANSFMWDRAGSTPTSSKITGLVQLVGSQTTFNIGTTQFSLSNFATASGGKLTLLTNGAIIQPSGGDGNWVQVSQTITASFVLAPAVPEPGTLALAFTGLGGLAFWGYVRRRRPGLVT
jgi:hypothetical protein